jgi:hypothetical protein
MCCRGPEAPTETRPSATRAGHLQLVVGRRGQVVEDRQPRPAPRRRLQQLVNPPTHILLRRSYDPALLPSIASSSPRSPAPSSKPIA